jgi:hypothetical protein
MEKENNPAFGTAEFGTNEVQAEPMQNKAKAASQEQGVVMESNKKPKTHR